jgi:hypothetical protein
MVSYYTIESKINYPPERPRTLMPRILIKRMETTVIKFTIIIS